MQATDISTLEAVALAATRSAAVACYAWVGRNDQKAADAAATSAMRAVLADAPGRGTVVIGEGEKDDAPMLFNGEVVGNGNGPDFDIAVDPLEGTSFCAWDLPGSLATIAFGAAGSMWSPGPGFYMDKIVVPPRAKDVIDLDDPPEHTLVKVARALGKEVSDLHVMIMDKPRHKELIARVLQAGAAVQTPAGGDVGGSLAVLVPTLDVDLLLGVGGTPEGVMTAAAVRALGGGMLGRLAPQRDEEADAIRAAGMSLDRIYECDELVAGDAFFVATGITGGPLVGRPRTDGAATVTESLLISRNEIRHITHTTFD
ncbi:MAG: fructose-bisphosphatase, class II [Pseudonocardia sp. SCN 73-27]|uniref:class II fructose-bisphosphatase n=1 Tax=Pseudonocardia sp. SCN 73-27 TaxID=1660132 RepID=UPI00086889F1|nr:class II fructose-bisphosphatase [Pseudonocardia sp. SCN 73-27]ODU25424.1 MAG: fructose-bisphosphatase, class II [Pseudonocardia sp. SCN 72-51]ODU99564.1 MAG: fructose-bisphosphatase, class II [Pseudonocardia sp. SCN 73-27]